jgi:integrase
MSRIHPNRGRALSGRTPQSWLELRIAGPQLKHFARYADARDTAGSPLDLQLDWARDHGTAPITWARRLEIVRPFARYYRQFEPSTAVPGPSTFGGGHRRLAPHIYTEREICDLLEEAGRLSPHRGLRPATYRTLFGLIAATGLRLSEALHLRSTDVDLPRGIDRKR